MAGFVPVGELNLVWRNNWTRWRCGCGMRTGECPFWISALTAAYGDDWRSSLLELGRLHRRVVRHRDVPRLAHHRLRSREFNDDLADFGAMSSDLYRGILDTSEQRVVVDASKLGVEAIALAVAGRVDVRVVHLVRDPRAVAHSWARMRPRAFISRGELARHGPVRSTLEWDARNVVAEQSRRFAPYMRVRYDELLSEPAATLHRIAELAGEPMDELGFLDGRSATLGPSHAFAGNPMREQTGTIELRPDDEWQRVMPRRRAHLVQWLSWPVRRRYFRG
jgi:hypothetical protein